MRTVALLLVLSLTAPAVAAAVCELTCARANHHEANAAAAADCHEQQPNTGTTALTRVIDGECHRDSELPTVVTPVLEKGLFSATVPSLMLVTFAVSTQPAFTPRSNVSPPDSPPRSTTPLRI